MPAVGVAVVALATATIAPARAAPDSFRLGDLARIVSFYAPQISPDGRHARALISRADTEHDRSAGEIDSIDSETGVRRAPTTGRRVAFIAADPGAASEQSETGRPQVFVMPLDGSDALAVTNAPDGDARVALVSSHEYFHALRDLAKPATFIVYPVDGHFPHDPARYADVHARRLTYIGDHFTL